MADREQIITDILVNSSKGVKGINDLTHAATKLDSQLQTVLQHLDAIEKKSSSAPQNITKAYKTINTHDTNFKIGKQGEPFALSKNGMIVKGSSKRQLKALEDELINYEKQNVELAKKNVKLREEEAKARQIKNAYISKDYETKSTNAQANLTGAKARLLNAQTVAKESSDLTNYRKFKNSHPELYATAGGLNYNWKYQVGRGVQGAGQGIGTAGLSGKLFGGLLDTMGAFLKSPAVGVAATITNLGKAITDLGTSAVKAFAEIESIKTQLGIVFSSQTQADTAFGQISQYAVKSPFGVQQTSELAVLLKQSGVYATDLMDTLRMIGDTAGGNMEKMKRIANNYAQIVSIGKASMLDMRQFAYAGIPIFEAVSKELGVSQQELRKLISDGKVTSDIIEKVFKDLTGINGIFENATEIGAKTLKARLQNLADAKQLASASIGEWIVNKGETYGNDSFVNNIVSGIENIYQYLRDSVNTVNIEKSVDVIENRNGRIEELKQLIEYAKQSGNKTEAKQLQKELEAVLKLRDIEKERSIYNTSYENKKGNYDEAKKAFEESGITSEINKLWTQLGYTLKENYSYSDYLAVADMYGFDELSKAIRDLIKAEEGLKSITTEETQAHRESNVINAQQLAFDQAAKAANKDLSYASGFEKLYSVYTSSDEYKKKKEQEETKWLEESKKVLKELLSYKNNEGNIDLTKMTYKKLIEYLDEEKRVLNEGSKLTVVEGKSNEVMTRDRQILSAQYRDIFNKIDTELAKRGDYSARNAMGISARQINYNADNQTFFKEFARVLDEQLSIFDGLIENAENDKDRQDYKEMRKALLASTFKYEAPSAEGLNASTDQSSAKQEFIPLWKRIIAQYTGLTTQGMTGSMQAMNNYANDMAIRNLASGVLSATFKTMGLNAAMGLVRSSGQVKTLRGDTGGTAQVDWKETKVAMHNFAMQLSASTEVINAYKAGLEAELETYQNLVAAGFTQAESQDLNEQKFVSTKQMEKLAKDAGEQLVNAFSASQFKTKSGAAAYLHEDGQFYDAIEGGNRIAEDQLIVEENLWKFIQARLPELQNEIHEANVTSANNAVLKKMYSDVASTQYLSSMLAQQGVNNVTRFLSSNPEYIDSVANSLLTRAKNLRVLDKNGNITETPQYKHLQNLSNEDIFLKSIKAEEKLEKIAYRMADINTTLGEEGLSSTRKKQLEAEYNSLEEESNTLQEVLYVVSAAFGEVTQSAQQLANNEGFQLLQSASLGDKREKALNDALINIGAAEQKEIVPEEYSGQRGFRNWYFKNVLGDTRAYDNEDLYAKVISSAKNDYQLASKLGINMFNEEGGQRFTEGMSAEDISAELTSAEKSAIGFANSIKEAKNAMKDLGAETLNIANTMGKNTLNKSFEAVGAAIIKGSDAAEDYRNNMKALTAEMLQNVGVAMQEAGWNLISMGARNNSKAYIAAGAGLVVAGGVAAGLGGALAEAQKDKSKTNKETEKLESLKDDLTKLLEQARSDALYYENNLRHKTALGVNEQFSHKSVHDAVITPKGDVVTTDPKDYLIATKTPKQLVGGGGVTVQPVINCNVINNSSAKIRQEQTQNSDGSIDIVTIVEEIASGFIASPRSDDAFTSRQARLRGRQAIM